jgi:hypothetical protein
MVAGGIQQGYSSDPVGENSRVSESRSAIDSTMRNKEIAQARGNKTVSTATIGQGKGINAAKLGHVRNSGSANVKQTKNVRVRMNKSAFQQRSVGTGQVETSRKRLELWSGRERKRSGRRNQASAIDDRRSRRGEFLTTRVLALKRLESSL